jgi:hypothetical protein
LLFFLGCKKEGAVPFPSPVTQYPNPGYLDVPSIALENYFPDAVTANRDALTFSIRYIDGDQDSEAFAEGETAIELTDNRDKNRLVYLFHPEPRSVNALFGDHTVRLRHTILLDPTNESEQTTFSIRLRDRAGHWSNSVRTGTVRILR